MAAESKIKLVYVYFPKEKNSFVIDVKKVVDFNPKSVDDFDKSKLYDVKWAVLQNEGSGTTECIYQAYIRCLAASETSMVHRAAALRLKLPYSFKVLLQHHKPAEKAPRVSKESSKLARRQVNMALESASRARMQRLIKIHKDKVTPVETKPTELSTENILPATTVSSPEQRNPESEQIVDKKSIAATPALTDNKIQVLPSEPDHSDIDVFEIPKTKVLSRKRKLKEIDDETTEASECSFASSSHQVLLLENKVIKLQSTITALNKELRITKTELNSLQQSNKIWRDAYIVFQTAVKKMDDIAAVAQPLNEPVNGQQSGRGVDTGTWQGCSWEGNSSGTKVESVCRNLFSSSKDDFSKHQSSLVDACSPKSSDVHPLLPLKMSHGPCRSPWKVQTTVPITEVHQGDGDVSPPKTLKDFNKSVTTSSDAKGTDEMPDVKNLKEMVEELPVMKSSLFKSPMKSKSPKIKTPIKTKSPTVKTPKTKSSSKKRKNLADTNSLRDGEKTGKELANMILMDLKGEQPLQENGNKQVHIGNNCWIKKEFYQHKVKNGKKLSIIIKDLAEEIWGFKMCAQMSVCGGTSVKDPSAEPKPAAPAHEREAIFGIFRAKLMMEGSVPDAHLERAEKCEARKYLREKFQDSCRKRKTALDTAAAKAEKELQKTQEQKKPQEEDI